MSSEKIEERGWKHFKENLKKSYRLVVMNNESFEEVGSYQLSLLNLYIAICGTLVTVALLVFLLIFFTPIKRMIPGYGEAGAYNELMELNKEMDELNAKFVSNETYINAQERRLKDSLEIQEDFTQSNLDELAAQEPVNRIQEDELLRKEVEANDLLQKREKMQAANGTLNEVPLEQLFFIPPITGVVSDGFTPEKQHYGVDILAPKNTPIKTVMDGYVIASDWTLETGNTIGIQHANGIVTFYKHNSALLKKTGNFVKAGEAVAIIGNTGTLSNGPHLHFELWHNGKPINPIDFVNFE